RCSHRPLSAIVAGLLCSDVRRRSPTSLMRRSATWTSVVERPHLAGNSLGGLVAIELARRGRAATVCAFSPGGFWSADFQPRALNKLQRGIALARRIRSILPFMYKSATVRRLILRDVAWHGDRVSADRALEAIDEGIDCAILADLCAADWQDRTAGPAAMPDHHRMGGERDTPSRRSTRQDRAHSASIDQTLPGVSHVPMIDDPGLVARTILA